MNGILISAACYACIAGVGGFNKREWGVLAHGGFCRQSFNSILNEPKKALRQYRIKPLKNKKRAVNIVITISNTILLKNSF